MYNTKYKCVKRLKLKTREGKEFIVLRNTKWSLVWCGGANGLKELFNGKMTLFLPDYYVERYFKKI